ncbi:MAG: ATP-binding protein [Acidimicrobiia bacterium]
MTQSLRQRWRFPATTASVASARNAVAGLVAEHHPTLADDVRIVVSELASNAVLHAGTPYDVLAQVAGDRVRVEVADAAPALPAVRYPALEATSGRGLHLITALCERWGVEQRGGGKVVWVELVAR